MLSLSLPTRKKKVSNRLQKGCLSKSYVQWEFRMKAVEFRTLRLQYVEVIIIMKRLYVDVPPLKVS